MKLYEITDAYRLAVAELDDAEGEVSDDLAARLDAIGDALAEKVDACLALAAEAAAEASAADHEAKRLLGISKAAARRSEGLRAYVLRTLDQAGIPSVKGARFQARVQAGRPRVVVDDLEALPVEFRRVKVEADKTALGEALKHGEVPGAHVELGPKSLVVR